MKFANVTYGTHGDTDLYTYLVNDNVRSGDFINPSVKHPISGKIYGTTAIIQDITKDTSIRGRELKQKLDEKGVNVEKAFTGKEVGATRGKGEYDGSGLGKTVKNEQGRFEGTRVFEESQYIEQARKGNEDRREQSERETFESYSSKFNKGEK